MPRLCGYCAYCGNFRTLTRDHVIPKWMKTNTIPDTSNILLVCGWCNSHKGDHSLLEWLRLLPLSSPQHIYVPRFVDCNEDYITQYRHLQLQHKNP